MYLIPKDSKKRPCLLTELSWQGLIVILSTVVVGITLFVRIGVFTKNTGGLFILLSILVSLVFFPKVITNRSLLNGCLAYRQWSKKQGVYFYRIHTIEEKGLEDSKTMLIKK